jgi:hypothetical protein
VGGIPELLDDSCMFEPGSAKAIEEKIIELTSNPLRMKELSIRNIEKAKEYRESTLRKTRNTFYTHVKNKTEEWMRHYDVRRRP